MSLDRASDGQLRMNADEWASSGSRRVVGREGGVAGDRVNSKKLWIGSVVEKGTATLGGPGQRLTTNVMGE